MKARIKKTGEIVNIADYATITLDSHDSWGNPIEVKPEEIELIDENEEIDENVKEMYEQWGIESPLQDYWYEVKERASIAILQGLLSNSSAKGNIKDYVKCATEYADTLIAELKKEIV